MTTNVSIAFHDGEVTVHLHADHPPLPADQARRWLDEQFIARDCEILRATGKVLTVDKLLAVADAIGLAALQADEALRVAFARAAAGAVGKPSLKVDLTSNTVAY
jgi:hypothetical protein